MAKSKGIIFELYNNFGTIDSSSFKQGEETIPFEITPNMIIEKDGLEYIRYTHEVTFDLKRTDNIRDKQIKEAVNVEFIGTKELFKKRNLEKSYEENVADLFKKYCFVNPHPNNLIALHGYLDEIGFRPRMLEYLLAQGIFLTRDLYRIYCGMPESELSELQFDPKLLIIIDKIDQRFSSLVVKWIVALELAYKDAISLILSNAESSILREICNYWKSKNNKGATQFNRAKAKRKFRQYSELFDYISQSDQVPIEDLMEQLDLSELPEFLKKIKEIGKEYNLNLSNLDVMYTSVSLISDLSVLRNAAAHGRSLIIGFMDPDFNANWDLTIDNPESRGRVEQWELYDLMYDFWSERSSDADRETINMFISTVSGNPYRRSWAELHYLYHSVVCSIDLEKYKQFCVESDAFLNYEGKEGLWTNLFNVDLTSLCLSDMGPTTGWPITPITPPYREIANEAIFVRKAIDMRTGN